MAQRVCLQIGVPKAGSTYLQGILWAGADLLRESGVLVHGRRADHLALAHWTRGADGHDQAAERLLSEVRRWPGTAVISSEWFSMATAEQVTRLVDRFDGQPIDVVLTARSYWSAAPSAWQQTLKAGLSSTLSDFVAGMDHHTEAVTWAQRWGWETLDPASVLPRWRAVLPRERVHLVTVPPPGSDRTILWQRFTEACGLDPMDLASRSTSSNSSLSAEAARLLQLLGPRLRGPDSAQVPVEWIRTYLGDELLAAHRGSPIQLDPASDEIIRARAEAGHAALSAADHHLVGDLDDLLVEPVPRGARAVEDVRDDEVLEVALEVIPPLLARVVRGSTRSGSSGHGRAGTAARDAGNAPRPAAAARPQAERPRGPAAAARAWAGRLARLGRRVTKDARGR